MYAHIKDDKGRTWEVDYDIFPDPHSHKLDQLQSDEILINNCSVQLKHGWLDVPYSKAVKYISIDQITIPKSVLNNQAV